MRVLNINVAFHDPAAAVAVDGKVVAAAEEKRLSRRKHGKCPVPFPAWDLPELAARWRPAESGIGTGDLDAIAKVTNVAYHVTHAAGPGPDVPGCDRGACAGGPRPRCCPRTSCCRTCRSSAGRQLPDLDRALVRYVALMSLSPCSRAPSASRSRSTLVSGAST